MPLYVEYGESNSFETFWNFTFKIFYMLSSAYTVFIMMRVYARTREKEGAWKLGGASMASALVLAPFVMMIFKKKFQWGFREVGAQMDHLWACARHADQRCSSRGLSASSSSLHAFSLNYSSSGKPPCLP